MVSVIQLFGQTRDVRDVSRTRVMLGAWIRVEGIVRLGLRGRWKRVNVLIKHGFRSSKFASFQAETDELQVVGRKARA